jgi:hypothetical protein
MQWSALTLLWLVVLLCPGTSSRFVVVLAFQKSNHHHHGHRWISSTLQPTTTGRLELSSRMTKRILSRRAAEEQQSSSRSSSSQFDSADHHQNNNNDDAFSSLVQHLVETVIASDTKRDTKGLDGASTGWTNWVDEAAAARLSRVVANLRLTPPHNHHHNVVWRPWIMSCPSPVIVDYTPFLANEVRRHIMARTTKQQEPSQLPDGSNSYPPANEASTTTTTTTTDTDALLCANIASRLGMRLLYLPSGGTFRTKWRAPPGAMIYGLALQGGVKRFRRLGGGSGKVTRKAGERTIIVPSSRSSGPTAVGGGGDTDTDLSWLQYGGPERNYEALDIGPCLFLEVLLYPDGLQVTPLFDNDDAATITEDLVISSPKWHPQDLLSLAESPSAADPAKTTATSSLSSNIMPTTTNTSDDARDTDIGRFKDQLLRSVGGLPLQIDQVIRRVVDGRGQGQRDNGNNNNGDMAFLYSLGLAPIRGLLLYGPPGW